MGTCAEVCSRSPIGHAGNGMLERVRTFGMPDARGTTATWSSGVQRTMYEEPDAPTFDDTSCLSAERLLRPPSPNLPAARLQWTYHPRLRKVGRLASGRLASRAADWLAVEAKQLDRSLLPQTISLVPKYTGQHDMRDP